LSNLPGKSLPNWNGLQKSGTSLKKASLDIRPFKSSKKSLNIFHEPLRLLIGLPGLRASKYIPN
jgi:hypothetical protein